MTSSDRFPVPVRSAVKSNFTNWCCQNLSKRALNNKSVIINQLPARALLIRYFVLKVHGNGECMSMVWPTLGSRTAKEQEQVKGADVTFNC